MDCLLWLIVLGQKINKSCVTKDDTLGTTPKLYIPITINTALTLLERIYNFYYGNGVPAPLSVVQLKGKHCRKPH